MGTSSESHFNNQFSRLSLLQTSLGLVLPDGYPTGEDRESNSDQNYESSESETRLTDNGLVAKKPEKENENGLGEHSVTGLTSNLDKMSLQDVARERVELIAQRMQNLQDGYLDKFKNELRTLLEGLGSSQQREEFLFLQNLIQTRDDLTERTINLSQASLFDIFFCTRCKNIACGSVLPARNCTCDLCSERNGFCNLCTCVICNKFDFEVNTCSWIGCDLCTHWTHTDCAIQNGLIGMGACLKNGRNSAEMVFRCRACNSTCGLLGWVKYVFLHSAPTWDKDVFIRELDIVTRIFRGYEDARGMRLFLKCDELIEKLKSGLVEPAACRTILLLFFHVLEVDPFKNNESSSEYKVDTFIKEESVPNFEVNQSMDQESDTESSRTTFSQEAIIMGDCQYCSKKQRSSRASHKSWGAGDPLTNLSL